MDQAGRADLQTMIGDRDLPPFIMGAIATIPPTVPAMIPFGLA
jgi:hypothetical protein